MSAATGGRVINELLSKLELLNEDEIDEFSTLVMTNLFPVLISTGLITPDEVQMFIFAKNVKLYGGINEYVDDFLDQTLPRLRDMKQAEKQRTKLGMTFILQRMKTYAGIDDDHKKRVEEALEELQAMAGGRRRKSRRTRRQRRRISRRRN